MRNSKPAAEQFAALGIEPKEFTDAMRLAVKQKWSNLRIDEKVDVLRREIEDVEAVATPSADMLQATGFSTDPDECRSEAARLKRNATVNAWRTRTQLQAALDARELRYAKRGKKAAAAKPKANAGAAR